MREHASESEVWEEQREFVINKWRQKQNKIGSRQENS